MPTLSVYRTVRQLGATKWWIKEVNADGSDLSPADTYAQGWIRAEHEFSISVRTETRADEGGNTHTLAGTREARLTLTLAENHAGAWNFAQSALLQGKHFAIVIQRVGPERGGNHAGKYEYQFFPLCQLAGDLSSRLPGTDLQLVFTVKPVPASRSVTLNGTTLPGYDGAAGGTVTVAAGDFASQIVEVNPSAS
jgi:hypothetical protein